MLLTTTGQWMQEDPIQQGGGQANFREYVGNDPTNRTDPSGLAPEKGEFSYELTSKEAEIKTRFEMKNIGYVFQTTIGWRATDSPNVKNREVIQINKGTTFGISSDGNSQSATDYRFDHQKLGADALIASFNDDLSSLKLKSEKKDWILYYRRVEKTQGFAFSDKAGTLFAERNGSEIKEGRYDELYKVIVANQKKGYAKGKSYYTYLYINTANADAKGLDVDAIIKKIDNGAIKKEVALILKLANLKLGKNDSVSILYSEEYKLAKSKKDTIIIQKD
jgi:hypothetical protein